VRKIISPVSIDLREKWSVDPVHTCAGSQIGAQRQTKMRQSTNAEYENAIESIDVTDLDPTNPDDATDTKNETS